MVIPRVHATRRYSTITGKQNSEGQRGSNGGLLSWDEVHRPALGIGRRCLDIVTDAEIDRQVRQHAPVVLEE